MSRYDEFKKHEQANKHTVETAVKVVGGASVAVAGLSVLRIAMNPFSPLNFLRTPVAVAGAIGAVGAAVTLKKLHDCKKGEGPCP